jgi:gamma-glutamyl hercynylcysteine S-oxide synthase
MSLILDKRQVSRLLDKEEFKIYLTNEELLKLFTKTFNRTNLIFKQIQQNTDKKGTEKSNSGEDINPILWQCGHIVYFYKKHCQKYFDINHTEDVKNNIDFYDSFVTKSKFRYNKNRLLDLYVLFEEYEHLYKIICDTISKNKGNKYVLLLSILHNEMHIEALIFSGLHLEYVLKDFISAGISNISLREDSKNIIENPIFIQISSGSFVQGSRVSSDYLSFDNERPAFRKIIEDFSMSETPITEYQFLQFILDDGYNNPEYWTNESWQWIKDNNIECPLYWTLDPIHLKNRESNYPICNISWYEAKAYCSWAGVRLPTESEWEYVATYLGKYKYPWGNVMIPKYCNLNYRLNRTLEVDDERLKIEHTPLKVKQLIGNVWEWCEEPIYPYNGFNIDPIYREMSYPFFGFKKICRGGCFAMPDYLIHSRYRNSQMPDCRVQFIGFRVCKDELNLKSIRKKRRFKIGLCTDI